LPNVELSYAYTNYNRGAKGSTYVLLFSKNIFSSAQYFQKNWDWPIKMAFTNKQTKSPKKN
jgi:hypothetical protein